MEVLDDPNENKLYLMMDFIKKGKIKIKNRLVHYLNMHFFIGAVCSSNYYKYETNLGKEHVENKTVPMDKIRKYLRDCLKGLDYCTHLLII